MAGLDSKDEASGELGQPWCCPCLDKEGVYRPAMSYCNDLIEFHCESGLRVERLHVITSCKYHWPVHQEDEPLVQRVYVANTREKMKTNIVDHCILVSAVCSDQQHKRCKVISIQEARTSFNIALDRQTFSRDVEILLEYVTNTSKSLQMNINNLAKKKHITQ